jgi:hypothetical protein
MLKAMSAALEAMKGRKKMKFSAINNDIDKKKTIWIKEDASVTGVFMGDIHDFKVHWVDKRKQVCRGKDCQHCANGAKANFQFRINLVHKDHEGNLMASIYENDWFTYQRMAELNETYPLETSLIKVYKGMDKGYKVDLFEFVKKIDLLQGIKLNELEESVADYSNKLKDLSDSPNFDDIPF